MEFGKKQGSKYKIQRRHTWPPLATTATDGQPPAIFEEGRLKVHQGLQGMGNQFGQGMGQEWL